MSKALRLVQAISDRAQATNRPVMWASLTGDQHRLLNSVKPERDELFRVGELALFRGSSAAGGGGGAGGPGGIAGYAGSGDEGGIYDPSTPSASSPVGTDRSTSVGDICTYTSYGQAKIAYRQYKRLAAQAKEDGKMALFRRFTLMWKCAKNEMERLGAESYEGTGYWGSYGDVCSRTQKWYNKRLRRLENWQQNPPRLFANRRISRMERLVQTSRNKAISNNCAWAMEPQRQEEYAIASQEQAQIDQIMQQEYQAAQQGIAAQNQLLLGTTATKSPFETWHIVAAVGGAGLLFAMIAVARKRAAG